eukprot:scaffold38944_cov63-Phaeocystis_antarctica.AAC.2
MVDETQPHQGRVHQCGLHVGLVTHISERHVLCEGDRPLVLEHVAHGLVGEHHPLRPMEDLPPLRCGGAADGQRGVDNGP